MGLVSIAPLSAIKVKKAEGIGAGASSVPAIFSASSIKVDDSVNKINGLANEYTGVAAAVRALVDGSRQVPAHEGRAVHAGQGCPPGGQAVRQEWQLRVRQRSRRRSLQQAQRL